MFSDQFTDLSYHSLPDHRLAFDMWLTMSSNTSFRYELLLDSTSIRVLIINSGAGDDEIHCQSHSGDFDADGEMLLLKDFADDALVPLGRQR